MSIQPSIPGVHTDFWIDYGHGKLRGTTFTVSSIEGGYIIAFLALYISVAGTQLWLIVRFILHQLNARHKQRNAFLAQQQLVLRNGKGMLYTAWRFFQIGWAWRGLEPYSILRSLHFVLLALLLLAAFSLSAIFSSKVSKAAGSSVLIRSTQCGIYQGLDAPPLTDQAAINYNLKSQVASAWTYAQNCYGIRSDRSSGTQCSIYVRQALNWTTNANASCPFDDSMCILNGTRSLQLDTGLIDSQRDLGINAPPANQIAYRKVTTCAPIYSDQFSRILQPMSGFLDPRSRNDSSFPHVNDTTQGPFQVFYYGQKSGDSGELPIEYWYNMQDLSNVEGYDIG